MDEPTLADILGRYRDQDIGLHSVVWFPERWRADSARNPQQADLVDTLALRTASHGHGPKGGQRISRADVFDCRARGPVAVFVASMIFGFGDRGYGPSRTAKMLATPDAEAKIIEADRLLHAEGAGAAHRYLINRPGRLAWCRTPFITKFLYFAGFGQRVPGDPPLILDQVVRDRLMAHGFRFRLHYTEDYLQYLELARELATAHDLARVDIVERALFQG
jgi:hypothetical protein